MAHKYTKDEMLKVFEGLIESNRPLFSHRGFRAHLDRDQNLAANQMIREANGNIAYKSVNFELDDLSDQEIWDRIEKNKHLAVIEENAAIAIVKMAEKLKLLK